MGSMSVSHYKARGWAVAPYPLTKGRRGLQAPSPNMFKYMHVEAGSRWQCRKTDLTSSTEHPKLYLLIERFLLKKN